MENEPFMRLSVNGGEIDAHRYNLSLFTYIGHLAEHNHVFLVLTEEEDQYQGAHIWHDTPAYQPLMQFITEFNLPMHLNLNEVAMCDREARENFIGQTLLSDLGDFVPDEWTDEKPE